MAYLDDVFILSTDASPLDDAFALFDARTSSLQLNKTECERVSLEEISINGRQRLGTCVGSASARRDFLSMKIAAKAPGGGTNTALNSVQRYCFVFQ